MNNQGNGLAPKYAGRLYLAAILVPEIAVVLFYLFLPDVMSAVENNLSLNVLFSETIFLLLVTLACGFAPGKVREQLGLHTVRPATLLLSVLLCVVIEPLIQIANLFTSSLFGNAVEAMTLEMETGPWWCLFLLMAVYGPLVEELLCRGFLYRNLRASGHVVGAVLISALCFAVLHGNLNQASYAFIIGIYFAIVCEVTGSVWPTFLMHFMINGSSVYSLYVLDATDTTSLITESPDLDALLAGERLYLYLGIAAAVSIVVSILILVGMKKLENTRNREAKLLPDQKSAVLTPTMFIGLVIGLALIAVTTFSLSIPW